MMTMVALAMGASAAMGGPIRYTVKELPDGFQPTAMSGNGYIVGYDVGAQANALYYNGNLTYLNHTPSQPWIGNDRALAVNNSGQVGWQSDDVSVLNNSGQAAGIHYSTDWSPFTRNMDGSEVTIPSPILGRSVEPWGINDGGEVVGWMGASGGGHPLLYQNGQSIDLGLLPGAQGATAFDVNNAGQVVGGARGDYSHPFLWDSGKLYDLGTLGGIQGAARSINDKGQIVGWASTIDSEHAFLYESGRMFDLNDLIAPGGPILISAFGIDERGDIAVRGIQGSHDSYYLLTPMATAVPEPSGLVLTLTFLITVTATRVASRKVRSHHGKARTPQPASHRDGP